MKVTPIMATIVALVDTNDNLRLVETTPLAADGWLQSMWLRVFGESTLTPLTYSSVISPATQGRGQLKIPVPMKGADGTAMQGSLPFSWLIKAAVDDLIGKKEKDNC